MELENEMPKQYRKDHWQTCCNRSPQEQADADLLQTRHEARCRVNANYSDEDIQAKCVQQPKCRSRDAAKGRMDRAEIAQQEAREQRAS